MKKIMKGGGDEIGILLILICCCCCFCLSTGFGGYYYYNTCEDENASKVIDDGEDCFCGFTWCEEGNICNASGDCIDPPVESGGNTQSPSGTSETSVTPPPSTDYVPGPDICNPGDHQSSLRCSLEINHKSSYENFGFSTGRCFPSNNTPGCECYPGWSKSDNNNASGKCDTMDVNWSLFENTEGKLKNLDNESSNSKVYVSKDVTNNYNLLNDGGFHCPDGTYYTNKYFNLNGNPGKICEKCPRIDEVWTSESPSLTELGINLPIYTDEDANNYRTQTDKNFIVQNPDFSTDYINIEDIKCWYEDTADDGKLKKDSSWVGHAGSINDTLTMAGCNGSCVGYLWNWENHHGTTSVKVKNLTYENFTALKCKYQKNDITQNGAGANNLLLKKSEFIKNKTDVKAGKNIGLKSCLKDHSNAISVGAQAEDDSDSTNINVCNASGLNFDLISECIIDGHDFTDYEKVNSSLNSSSICDNASATCYDFLNYINNKLYDDIPPSNNDLKQQLRRGRYKITDNGIECNEDLSNASSTNINASGNLEPSTNGISYCIGKNNLTGQALCQASCHNGSCTTSESGEYSCECNDGYTGSLCHIKMNDICGVGGYINADLEATHIKQKSDSLGGIIHAGNPNNPTLKDIPNVNFSIFDVPFQSNNENLKLDTTKYECTCSLDEIEDRKGFNFTSGILDKNYFCNTPDSAWLHTNENTEGSVPGETVHYPLWYNPSLFNKEGKEKENPKTYESLDNMKTIINCASVPFTENTSDDAEDKGYQSGHAFRVNHGGQAECIKCFNNISEQDKSHGLNTINIGEYFGWKDLGGYTNYKKYEKLLINNPEIFLTKNSKGNINELNSLMTDTSVDFQNVCKPAYPGYYGTLGNWDAQNKWKQNTNPISSTSSEIPVGGEKVKDPSGTATPRPVTTSYIPRKKIDIDKVGCLNNTLLNWSKDDTLVRKDDCFGTQHNTFQDMDLGYSGSLSTLANDSNTDLDAECAYGVSQTPGTSKNGRACSSTTESSTWGWAAWPKDHPQGGLSASINPNQPIEWRFGGKGTRQDTGNLSEADTRAINQLVKDEPNKCDKIFHLKADGTINKLEKDASNQTKHETGSAGFEWGNKEGEYGYNENEKCHEGRSIWHSAYCGSIRYACHWKPA